MCKRRGNFEGGQDPNCFGFQADRPTVGQIDVESEVHYCR